MSTGPTPNPWIADLAPYKPGRARRAGGGPVEKLSANEAALGPSPKAVAAVEAAAEDLWHYPDPGAAHLRAAIAEAHGLDADRIVCGAGSDELLSLLAHIFAKPGDEIVHSQYGFAMYPVIARGLGARAVPVANAATLAADVDGLLAAVTERTRLVYLDNPNNPTGAMLPWDEVARLHRGLPGDVILVLDGAYAEAVTDPAYEAGAALVDAADNVVMSRTFSKLYGLAGLRLGWAYAPPAIADWLNRLRPPFNVNTTAQAAGVAALSDRDHLARARDHNTRWRDWLTAALMAAGIEVVPSQTNFVLARFPRAAGRTAKDALDFLADNGVLVRWLPEQGLEDCLRVTVGTEQQMHALAELLAMFMEGWTQAAEG
ncbi:histidinol-phosphate transaminase [Rhodothalassium salexigens]|uniref:histidinol-phosphate transaminase n=1 Tax=Rhodothalassium salexigens TaxID=1086 RepID=UPI0019119387|nr:histidinol-phosphate transaminase [Rhodothalassium salexigens]